MTDVNSPRPMPAPAPDERSAAEPSPAWLARNVKPAPESARAREGGALQVDKVVAHVTNAKPGAWKNIVAFGVLLLCCAVLLVAWKWAGPAVSVGGAAANADADSVTLHGIDKKMTEVLVRLAALEGLPDRVRALEIKGGGK